MQSPLFRDRDRIGVPFADVAADGGLRADRHAHRLRFGLFLFFYNSERHFGQGDAAAVRRGVVIGGGIEHKLQRFRLFGGVEHDFDLGRSTRRNSERGAAVFEVCIYPLAAPVHGGGEVADIQVGAVGRSVDELFGKDVDAQGQRLAAVVFDGSADGVVFAHDGSDGKIDVFIAVADDGAVDDLHGAAADGYAVGGRDAGQLCRRIADLYIFGLRFGLGFRLRFGHGVGRGRRSLGKRHFRDGDIAAVDGGIFIDGGIEHHLQALRAVRGVVHDLDGDRFAGGDLEGRAAPVAVGIHRLPVHGGGDVARLGIGRDLLVRHHVDAQSQRFAAVVGDFGGEGIVVFGDGADVGDVHVLIRCALDARIGDVHGVVLADGDGVVVALHGDIRAVDLNGGVGTAGHAGLNRALVREEHHLGQGDAAAVCIFVAAGAV